jgi:two-component system LytT family sensor kinase
MRPRTLLLLIAGWTLLAVLFGLQLRVDAMYAGHSISARQALILGLAGWYGWALLSPAVVWIARRVRIGWHVPIALALTFVKIAATTEILRHAGFPPRNTFSIANIPLNLLTYAAIVAATHGIDAYRHGREARALLAEARLDLLKTQLQPHFLFNALHSIAELMHSDVGAADRALMRVSELLRATLDAGSRQEITLAEELALVERYLEIEQIRLGDRLTAKVDVEPRALDALVPLFVLQPVVENAVRHGIATRTSGGTVTLHARVEAGELRIDVEDDGPGFKGAATERVGLTNTRARLAHLYGAAQRLEIGRSAGGGAAVRIVLPFRT